MRRYGMFEVLGIELEYMLVDSVSMEIRSVADQILNLNGTVVDEVQREGTSWSNELVSHVLEVKTDPPVQSAARAFRLLGRDLEEILAGLNEKGYTLLGTGMHPFMNPDDMQLWPGENGPIYETFHRIFDCRGHGWSNLQSMHLNLPFKNDQEFGQMMAAIRLALPLLPALSASSPICEMVWTGFQDYRLEVYRSNASRVPSVSGQVVPEPVFDPDEYHSQILEPIYRDLESLDPEGLIQEEWVNARGAIARFDRSAIEIRILDTQESLENDMAIALFVVELLRNLVEERWSDFPSQSKANQSTLVELFRRTCKNGRSVDLPEEYIRLLGLKGQHTAGSALKTIAERLNISSEENLDRSLEFLLSRGNLSRRMREALESQRSAVLTDTPVKLGAEVHRIYRNMGSPLSAPFSP
ncbi:MAG: glutamate--cysteine ligase [Spirochaetaceae bacterium]|nr:glutamate--cysteine ligase [Spirochaetaceae bacterium]|tara:strand:- start:164732 stop:165970 length:1239 start_codon:yes stop_codon:yes gene_type:complete